MRRRRFHWGRSERSIVLTSGIVIVKATVWVVSFECGGGKRSQVFSGDGVLGEPVLLVQRGHGGRNQGGKSTLCGWLSASFPLPLERERNRETYLIICRLVVRFVSPLGACIQRHGVTHRASLHLHAVGRRGNERLSLSIALGRNGLVLLSMEMRSRRLLYGAALRRICGLHLTKIRGAVNRGLLLLLMVVLVLVLVQFLVRRVGGVHLIDSDSGQLDILHHADVCGRLCLLDDVVQGGEIEVEVEVEVLGELILAVGLGQQRVTTTTTTTARHLVRIKGPGRQRLLLLLLLFVHCREQLASESSVGRSESERRDLRLLGGSCAVLVV